MYAAQENGSEGRQEILEQAGARGRLIFDLVRGIADDLDAAAPWYALYDPPDEDAEFFAVARGLFQLFGEIPARVQEVYEKVQELEGDGEGASVAELASQFDWTFAIVARERDAMMKALASDPTKPWDRERKSRACAIGADLKGKYQSALMGVAARIIVGERESGVEVEQLLFPEKEEEFARNQGLLEALEELLALLEEIPEKVPLDLLVASWGEGRRVDRYAMVDLSILVGMLGHLLKQSSRRALYSGDYHRILSYERFLSERVNKLQILHAGTWSENNPTRVAALYPRLVELSVEVAAVLDHRLLRELVGEERFADLAQRAAAGEAPPTQDPTHEEELVLQLRRQDLRGFLEQLLQHVSKRSSLVAAAERRSQTPAEESSPLQAARAALAAATSPVNPRWHAFLATVADPADSPTQAIKLRDELTERLVPALLEYEKTAQFGRVIASNCAEIASAGDLQPMRTTLRLLNRLRELLSETD